MFELLYEAVGANKDDLWFRHLVSAFTWIVCINSLNLRFWN